MSLAGDEADMAMSMNRWYVPFASRKNAAHRGKGREWNVSKRKWNLFQLATVDFSHCVLGGVMYVVVVCANRYGVVCTLSEPARLRCLALPPLG